jgi:hypothetical protein
MVFPKATYKNKLTSNPKMIYPNGFKYFELEIKIKYNHKNPLNTVKIILSERIPRLNIFMVSNQENEAWVMG